MSRIILIGLSQLETIGLKWVIMQLPTELSESDVCVFSGYPSKEEGLEQADCFIVSNWIFTHHLDFFLPRRGKTIIVVRNAGEDSDENETSSKSKNGPFLIGFDSTPESISEVLENVMQGPEEKQIISGALSGREKEVLKELASGRTNKEIGDRLSISVNTVITHRKNISSKLGIKTVSGLSLYALMNGII